MGTVGSWHLIWDFPRGPVSKDASSPGSIPGPGTRCHMLKLKIPRAPANTWLQLLFSRSAQLCPALCSLVDCSTPGFPVLHHLPEFAQTHVHQVHDAIQPSHPLSSPSPPARTPPSIRVFSNESTLRMRCPKYWSFSFSIISSKEHPGLISFRMDWLDLAVQGTLKSLLFSSYTSSIPCMTSEKSLGTFVLRVFIWEKEISKILLDLARKD